MAKLAKHGGVLDRYGRIVIEGKAHAPSTTLAAMVCVQRGWIVGVGNRLLVNDDGVVEMSRVENEE